MFALTGLEDLMTKEWLHNFNANGLIAHGPTCLMESDMILIELQMFWDHMVNQVAPTMHAYTKENAQRIQLISIMMRLDKLQNALLMLLIAILMPHFCGPPAMKLKKDGITSKLGTLVRSTRLLWVKKKNGKLKSIKGMNHQSQHLYFNWYSDNYQNINFFKIWN